MASKDFVWVECSICGYKQRVFTTGEAEGEPEDLVIEAAGWTPAGDSKWTCEQPHDTQQEVVAVPVSSPARKKPVVVPVNE
jgi:hypothetical protein